jgi:hypothetical protein
MQSGCNAFDPKIVGSDYASNVYFPELPEIGLQAGMFGEPEPKE